MRRADGNGEWKTSSCLVSDRYRAVAACGPHARNVFRKLLADGQARDAAKRPALGNQLRVHVAGARTAADIVPPATSKPSASPAVERERADPEGTAALKPRSGDAIGCVGDSALGLAAGAAVLPGLTPATLETSL